MKNDALNILQLLANNGAEFEDQELALEIIKHGLEKSVNSALQEAADKIYGWNVGEGGKEYERGFDKAIERAIETVKSLQIKDTKEPTIHDIFKE